MCLGYLPGSINSMQDGEKEAIVIEEYLFILREDDEDCRALSLEEMAEYIVDYKRGAT